MEAGALPAVEAGLGAIGIEVVRLRQSNALIDERGQGKKLRMHIALLEIPVSNGYSGGTAFKDVIDEGVKDRDRPVGDTGIRISLLEH